MGDLLLAFGEDGKEHMYDSDFDVTIHCENEQQMNEAVELLYLANRMHWRKTAETPPTKEAAKNSRKGSDKYTDLVTEMLETAIRRVGGEYADMLFEYDRQRREAEKQCEQLAMEGMMKK